MDLQGCAQEVRSSTDTSGVISRFGPTIIFDSACPNCQLSSAYGNSEQ
jgi:hypothetical protein